MKTNTGYQTALRLGEEELRKRDPQTVALNAGVRWSGEDYIIPWLNQEVPLTEGSTEERIIWLHYLLGQGPKQPRNRFINYKQVPGAAIYNQNFVKRCIGPMVKAFGNDLDTFWDRGRQLGGERVKLGHMAFTLRALPYIPLTYVIWEGDDEIPASGSILFDESAIEWLCAEDLVVLSGLPVYRMLSM
jgi:hypothetical protein